MNTTRLKDLPIGIQTFEKIIEGNFLYIDKTKYIFELLKPETGVYFLSRPRRFGKSLLISTLEAIFKGRKELFKDLWIANDANTGNYDWEEYPVIRIDMTDISKKNADNLDSGLRDYVKDIANEYGVSLQDNQLEWMFRHLIQTLFNKFNKRVVVLIDEYDKPLLDRILEPEIAYGNREILKNFYSILKSQDEYLRFVLLTGVSKFAKVSVFSGLNNLEDISMDTKYSAMLGYTQAELEQYFDDRLDSFAKLQSKTKVQLLDNIKQWYNGYRFARDAEKIYNPFSTLLLFQKKEFRNYWFETATPTFLINLIKSKNYLDFKNFESITLSEFSFSTFEIENLEVMPLMFQTGYLTIKEGCQGNFGEPMYTLAYPNFEVKNSFKKYLLNGFAETSLSTVDTHLSKLKEALKSNNWDNFFTALKVFFANIPYELHVDREQYYQSIFFLIFSMLSYDIQSEVSTNVGRIDAVLESGDNIYIFEFKLDGTEKDALNQIKEKKYYEKYLNRNKGICLIGVNFDSKKKNIENWVIEEFSEI